VVTRRRYDAGMIHRLVVPWLAAALVGACASAPPAADPASDAPEARLVRLVPGAGVDLPPRYADALAAWRRPADVNAWIGATFEYDTERALALSESQRAAGRSPAITTPAAFYDRPRGICVDLARFAVETLRTVAPETRPRYLMIEFDPLTLRGQVLRRHWVALYEDAAGLHVIADSKRPGVAAGPYPGVAEFVADYARYRGRTIVAWRELDSFERRTRAAAPRQPRAGAAEFERTAASPG
jgi:hypothetical protein